MVLPDFVSGALTLVAVLAALALFALVGRAASGGSRFGDLALPAGWGVASLIFTVVGGPLGAPLYVGVLLLLAGAATLLLRPASALPFHGSGILRVLGVSLGYLAITALVRVSAVDTFTYWIPNALFLHDHGAFPVDGNSILSYYPAFPINLQLISYIAGLVLPFFPSTAMIAANSLLIGWFAWLLARTVGGTKKPVSWGMAAFAMLLVTVLNPTYVPEIALTGLGDVSTGIVLAAAAYAAWHMLEDAAAGERVPLADVWVMGLCLAALIDIKESNQAPTGELVAIVLGLALLDRRTWSFWRIERLCALLLPALLTFAAWSYHVRYNLGLVRSFDVLPLSAWAWRDIPKILGTMAYVASTKGGYFGLIALIALRTVWLLAGRRWSDPALRLLAMTTLMFCAHTAFLLAVYLGMFPGQMGWEAGSFWRYNTQLGPLALLTAAVVVAPWWRARFAPAPAWARLALVALCLGGPLAAAKLLRVDLKGEQPRLWALGKELVPLLPPNAELDIVVPGDNGDWGSIVRGAVVETDPRRRDVTVRLNNTLNYIWSMDLVWLNCVSEPAAKAFGLADDRGAAVLLERKGSGWSVLHRWPKGVCSEPRKTHWL